MVEALAPLEVRVWGDLACFTRPELKTERVSYPMMTPSAARGVLEAIFWKREFSWRVIEIWVLHEIRWTGFVRNEVNHRISRSDLRAWAKAGRGGVAAEDHRVQRHTLALRDVAYLIRAQIDVRPAPDKPHVAKYRDQFHRRVNQGRCFTRPFLGCREFAAEFSPRVPGEQPYPVNWDLGRMLWGLDYEDASPGAPATPVFFSARPRNGVLYVPPRSALPSNGRN